MSFITRISKLFPQAKCKEREPMFLHTTLRVGGPADIFVTVTSTEDLQSLVRETQNEGLPYVVLGSGSNVLVSDTGVRGVVIHNCSNEIALVGSGKPEKICLSDKPRWDSDSKVGTFRGVEFKDLDYDESEKPRVSLQIDSGVVLPRAIYQLFDRGVTGLQWYGGIPGTIGGAVFNNIHGGTHFISEVLSHVEVISRDGSAKIIKGTDLGFEYDRSIFQQSGDVITRAGFKLFEGDVNRGLSTTQEWIKRKKDQPRNSPGSIFKNISNEDKTRLGYPTTSTGFLIEHVLKLTGYKVGGARIAEQHHNFIVNDGGATAKDCMDIITEVQKRARETAGIKLEPEIVFLGY